MAGFLTPSSTTGHLQPHTPCQCGQLRTLTVLPRQLLAIWFAEVLIAVGAGGGVAVRLLLARNYAGLLGWCAGALFIPTLALVLGVWTASCRPFEGVFTGLWYMGPLNRIPGFDFTGGANGPITVKYACFNSCSLTFFSPWQFSAGGGNSVVRDYTWKR